MIFVKTFKGYEDRTLETDQSVNDWIQNTNADVVDIKVVMDRIFRN